MQIITNNPYRIAGILANSSEKDILKQKTKIKRFSEIGKEITSEYDFPFISLLQRNNSNIDKAFSAIEQSQDKVNHSLFWFINLNPIDNAAIQYLINGNKEKAFEIWEKLTDEKEINSKNFSAFNNVGTLYLLEESKEKLKQGISIKIKLIESANFKDFICTVADENFIIESNKQIEILIDKLLIQLKDKYSTANIIDLFSDCCETAQKHISQKFTEEPIHKIETQIEQTKNKRIKDRINAYQFGEDLHKNTKNELIQLKSILGTANLQYKMLADNVAKEILQCSIDYFNESQKQEKSNNYLEEAIKLAKLADEIAVNKITKDRIKDNINALEEMKDKELLQAIEFLKSIKLTYEENERKIRLQVKEMEETDPLIISGFKTINWRAVEDSIKNSIDWQHVNKLLITVLSDNNLKKIKERNNSELKKEFWELANWLKENSRKNSTISVIIDKYKKIPPKLPFKIISSVITNRDKNNNPLPETSPLYRKHTRYVGLKINVECYESSNITFYKKYVGIDRTKYSFNKETSPKGYTSSKSVNINTRTKIIDLGSWGNNDSCTYSIGKHCIEVYVDEYLIHCVDFSIDLAPSEKIENQLKETEKKLIEIKKTAYLTSEINASRSAMEEVQKFKLFRSSSEKQRQIENQQRKIDELIKWSEAEKNKDIKKQETKIAKLNSELLETKY